MIDRRTFLTAAGAVVLAGVGHAAPAAGAALKLGPRQPFSFDHLREEARLAAQRPFEPLPVPDWSTLERLDYAAHGQIRFKPGYALFADGPGRFPVTFFHLGRFAPKPVRMYVLDGTGRQAREIVYDEDYFEIPTGSPAHALPAGIGFAGFRFQENRLAGPPAPDWRSNDWVAFLGASYFRAIGELYQYGLSARGIAVDVAVPDRPEEFPDFTHVYFEPQQEESNTVTVYARLDGPRITGAFRFDMMRDRAVLMEVDAALFLREDVARLGIAPLTSMYWFSETQKPAAIDWRPEVHDSDGLAMWTGNGEYIWRPLNNPPRTMASAFSDGNPRGFGLLQRDRDFDHYLDGVYYDRRPSLWVEPLGDWGPGTVQLVEIPTDDEIHDNIVAMWVPAAPAAKGTSYRLKYRLHWTGREPFPPPMARCVATRLGNGGQPGQPRPEGVRKFMVEFLGGPLAQLPYGVQPEPVLWASRGKFSYVYTEAVPNDVPGHWRAQFDLAVDGTDPVEMRLYLKSGERTLSETWLYQYHPANPA
ncbi:MAG: glucan biosynthesis protein D [Pigmentiphaga sp.]|uniref:glucan biosynthesis protein n=1 Tax=Pigmentiphaga sp. TaxID=1977564 RepID=UPI0029B43CDB|nr:glucan biosynthesis protein D [Pigmentiphaga sp.]MDX3908108.1 glucan biosynthesis protein D [Pigmentiphaga sp.]